MRRKTNPKKTRAANKAATKNGAQAGRRRTLKATAAPDALLLRGGKRPAAPPSGPRPGSSRTKSMLAPKGATKAAAATTAKRRPKQWSNAEIEEAFRRFRGQPGTSRRTRAHRSLHAPGRGGALGAGDRCGRQQGDPCIVRRRRHAGKDGGARRSARARPHQEHRPLSHQGQEPGRAVAPSSLPSMVAWCRRPAKPWRRCRGSAARPRTWCSTSPSAAETIAVDTHIFRVGNRTGLAPGKNPFEVETALLERVPPPYRRHAHHWLILHGRYICKAQRPLCWKCLINDLCRWPDKAKFMVS